MVEIMEGIELDFEDTQKDKFLTFSVETENYGLDIKHVTEIIGIQGITQIPHQPGYIKGVINLRGKIIPTMDIRLRFNKDERQYDERTCIIVLNIQEIDVGIVVDRVLEVLNIEEKYISPPPQFMDDSKNKFIKGIGKLDDHVVILLDSGTLLTNAQYEDISALDLDLQTNIST